MDPVVENDSYHVKWILYPEWDTVISLCYELEFVAFAGELKRKDSWKSVIDTVYRFMDFLDGFFWAAQDCGNKEQTVRAERMSTALQKLYSCLNIECRSRLNLLR